MRQELSSVYTCIPVLVAAYMSLSFCHLRCDRACFTAVRDQLGGRVGEGEGRGGEGRRGEGRGGEGRGGEGRGGEGRGGEGRGGEGRG